MPGCCVPQCSNHSRNGWRMFHFPRDPKRRLLWLVRVKRDKWQPTNSSCVCSAHFEASSFEQNRADGWKKLKPNAVPTVFPFKELPKERRPPRERNAHVPALFSDDAAAHNSSREVRNVLPSTTQEFSPADSSSDGEINERLAATETNNANGQLTSTPRDARLQETAIVTATQPLDSEAAELRKKIADLTAANNKLRQHHNESKNTVKKLQMQVRKLQKEATNFSRNTKFLNEDQIRALSRNNNHGNSWSAQTVKQGLKIKFACGTTGYETLRKIGYPLPSSRTLARRIQGLKFLPGILHEVIDVMRSKAEGMEDVEKDCVLFLDEMEIAPGFELDRGEDVLLGGTTLPSKPEEPANHALVFMLVGPIQPPSKHGNRYILTLMDYATRYSDAVALPSIETERVAVALVEMFSRFGVANEVLSDRGTNFTSDLMMEVARLLSARQLHTSPYHTRTNGMVERRLNNVLVADSGPMTRADAVFATVGEKRYFSNLDFVKGYSQIPLSEEPRAKTGFSTTSGLYQFRFMPFAIKTAPAVFAKLTRNVAEGVPGVEHRYDDVLVATETWEEHLRFLELLFKTIEAAGLTVSPCKCEFGM
nr:uncharacterized protein LOC129380871 [Dermacentor andersoni]